MHCGVHDRLLISERKGHYSWQLSVKVCWDGEIHGDLELRILDVCKNSR